MVAEANQTFGVVLIIAAAVGYLGLILRKSWRGQGGCAGCHTMRPSQPGANAEQAPPEAKSTTGTAFFPLENLADIARRRREQQEENRR
jgi:hypothetical protein